MSTRATYRIRELAVDNTVSTQTFYIHHDGYPEGCASYMKEFIKNFRQINSQSSFGTHRESFRPGKAICAFGMIEGAEFTEDHFAHGDTEYWWNIYCDGKDPEKWTIEEIKGLENIEASLKVFIERYA